MVFLNLPFWFCLVFVPTLSAAQTLTYADLVNRLTDLEKLAVLPDKGEVTAQWSSYNRSSVYDREQDKYIDWHAHADGTGYIRKEADGYVLAEIKGPGCIWRIWTAYPDTGRFIIYVDGQKKTDMPFTHRFPNS